MILGMNEFYIFERLTFLLSWYKVIVVQWNIASTYNLPANNIFLFTASEAIMNSRLELGETLL